MMKKRRKTYYVVLKKAQNRVYIFTTKQGVATCIERNVVTISRNMSLDGMYDTDDFTVWREVTIETAKKGFGM